MASGKNNKLSRKEKSALFDHAVANTLQWIDHATMSENLAVNVEPNIAIVELKNALRSYQSARKELDQLSPALKKWNAWQYWSENVDSRVTSIEEKIAKLEKK